MKQRILVVEDEPAVSRGVSDALLFNGYVVDVAADGRDAYRLARERSFDFIILDLMLPGMTGLEILSRLRDEQVQTPILILTAKGREQDRVEGLEKGADDYVVKPFSVRELVARVAAHLRRRSADRHLTKPVEMGLAEIDFARRQMRRDGTVVAALPKVIDPARYLLEHRGRVVTRDELLLKVWEYPCAGLQTRTVDNYVMKLRQ
ncbi:MAG: response regulator transcription factor, partial [Planctomycetota bacterium]